MRLADSRLTLDRGQSWQSVPVLVDPLTSEITVVVQRPTTLLPSNWPIDSEIQVVIAYRIGGTTHTCTGGAFGGIRSSARFADEIAVYVLHYRPAVLIVDNTVKRIGETGASPTVLVEVTALTGHIDASIQILAETAPAPDFLLQHSVGYVTSLDASQSGSASAALSLSINGTGTNRAAFVGVANSDSGGGQLGSATYAGNALTELWDRTLASFYADAGYRAVDSQMGSGSQTVTSTLAAALQDEHYLAVVTFDGVDQTTPVSGTAQASGTDNAPTVNTTGAASGDMVVDICWKDGGTIVSPGDQTNRLTETVGGMGYSVDTQPGSTGNTMSRSSSTSSQWGIGATVVKTAGAATGWGALTSETRFQIGL